MTVNRNSKITKNRFQRNHALKQALKIVLILTIVIVAAYGAVWFIDSLPEPAETDIISKSGIHCIPNFQSISKE